MLWKPAGAAAIAAVGNTFIRMVACGQTMAHLPQSMQIEESQTGIIWAMARFSYLVVPVGKVPSTGSALTGRKSPLPAISAAVMVFTKARWSASVGATITSSSPGMPSGTWTSRSSA